MADQPPRRVSGPLSVERFSGGQSNPTFLPSTPASKYVLRKKPDGDLLSSAHAIDREYRVMRALANTGVRKRAHADLLRGLIGDRRVLLCPGAERANA